MPFFGNSPTGQTRRRIFTHDGSNDADSRKDVPFGEFFTLLPFRGSKNPKNFGAWIGVFKPNSRNRKTCILYQNYCIDSNQILHSDKDHQMPFVDFPTHHTHITNPRWRTAAILEKSKTDISPPWFERFRQNLAQRRSSSFLTVRIVTNVKF